MICTICGCQQRKADVCVQCHSPLMTKEVQGDDPFGDLREDGVSEYEEVDTNPSFLKPVVETAPDSKPVNVSRQAPVVAAKTKPQASEPTPVKEEAPSKMKPSPSPTEAAQIQTFQNVLITTTQRVEGKRISTYFGLVHAEALIVSSEEFSKNTPSERRKNFNKRVSEVLQTLRQEAILFRANAIVATSFSHQVIDPKTILLSAMGTAVLLKDGK